MPSVTNPPTANHDSGRSQEFLNRDNLHTDDTNITSPGANTTDSGSHWSSFFTTSDIPDGATIDGIEVTIRGYDGFGDDGWWLDLRLSYDGGTSWTSVTRMPSTGDFSGTSGSPNTRTVGSSTDTWGRTWSKSELLGTTFKLDIKYDGDSFSTDCDLEYCTITVYYSTGGSTTNFQINIGDAWKSVAGMQINIGDAWKAVASAKINIGDAWKTIF